MAIVTDNLFFKAKLEGIITDKTVVDLDHKDAFDIIRKDPKNCICFGSHTSDRLEMARKLGAKAYPKSIFFKDVARFIGQNL